MTAPDSRTRLIVAACDLLWRTGYGAVSVDDLCVAAKVNKGSFYHHFASKAELVTAAFESYWDYTKPELDRIFSPEVPALERLTGYCAAAVVMQTAKRKEFGHVAGCQFAAVGCEMAGQDGDIRAVAALKSERTGRYFMSALRDAMRDGAIPVGDEETLARQIQAYITGVVTQARLVDSLEPLRLLTDGVLRLAGAAPVTTAVMTKRARPAAARARPAAARTRPGAARTRPGAARTRKAT